MYAIGVLTLATVFAIEFTMPVWVALLAVFFLCERMNRGRMVMLVLIAMQKLASSSVAAIRRALRRRLERLIKGREDFERRLLERQRPSYASLCPLRGTRNRDADATSKFEEVGVELIIHADEATPQGTPASRRYEETKVNKI
jgi:hypothetical protein